MKHFGMASVLLALLGCGSGVTSSVGQSQEALDGAPDPVLAWNDTAIKLIGPGGAAKAPVLGWVDAAILHTAIYDAVNAIRGEPYTQFASHPHVQRPASAYAATAAAAHDALLALYPGNAATIEAAYQVSLGYVEPGSAKTNGISVGQQTAAAILALRADDGRNAGGTFTTSGGIGVWVPTPPGFSPPLAPWARNITPWTMSSPSQFRAKPPPSLDSEVWIRDYNETKALGAKVGSTRTPEQTDIGVFWGDAPQVQANRFLRGIAMDQHLSLEQNARFFAMLNVGTSDAMIGCWDSKFHYVFWRPVTAIQAGGGNPALSADLTWQSNVITPSHPEYPAAHGCNTSSSVHTLQAFFGTDELQFTVSSNAAGVVQPVRTYARFSDLLEEALRARVYGGMHYRTSTEQGAKLGRKVVRHMLSHHFRPTHGRDDDGDEAGEDD
jgi:hypothetical protein